MRHPHVLKFYGICVEEPHLYIVTELASLSMEDLIAAKSKPASLNATMDDAMAFTVREARIEMDNLAAAKCPAPSKNLEQNAPVHMAGPSYSSSLSLKESKLLVTSDNDARNEHLDEHSTATINPLVTSTSSRQFHSSKATTDMEMPGLENGRSKDHRLQARWKSEDRLTVVMDIARQLLEALAFIHKKGVIHRGYAHVDVCFYLFCQPRGCLIRLSFWRARCETRKCFVRGEWSAVVAEARRLWPVPVSCVQ